MTRRCGGSPTRPTGGSELSASLQLDGLARRWGSVVGVDGLSLDVPDGELLALVGPSGCGKSTTLRLIAGLERPDAGRVLLDGRDVTGVAPNARGVAMVFQSYALFPHLNVAENIGFGLRARRTPPAQLRERVTEIAGRLGLDALLDRPPQRLSGGERQRVALARGLVGRPRVLLLDEPLSNLDAELRGQARAEIRRLQRELGITMVHVTHDHAEALALGTRVAVLRDGRLEQVGAPDDVYARPASAFVAGFLGAPPMNLLPAEVQDGTIVAGALRVAAPPGRRLADGAAVTLGFRPEDVAIGAGDGVAARVEVVERVGSDRLWYLEAGGARFTARPRDGGDRDVREGDDVRVTVDGPAAYLFSAEDGTAL